MALVYQSVRLSASLGHIALPVVTTICYNIFNQVFKQVTTLSIHLDFSRFNNFIRHP